MKLKISNEHMKFDLRFDDVCRKSFPSIRRLKSNTTKGDFVYKINGLWSLLHDEQIESYLEPMAGIGYSAKFVETFCKPNKIILNEWQHVCYESLIKTFTKTQKIYNVDVFEDQQFFRRVDCCFLDTDSFTFHKSIIPIILMLKLLNITNNIFLYSDTFPYSLMPFDLTKLCEYLKIVEDFFNQVGWGIDKVFLYPGKRKRVMLIKAKKNIYNNYEFIECSDPFTVRILTPLGI